MIGFNPNNKKGVSKRSKMSGWFSDGRSNAGRAVIRHLLMVDRHLSEMSVHMCLLSIDDRAATEKLTLEIDDG